MIILSQSCHSLHFGYVSVKEFIFKFMDLWTKRIFVHMQWETTGQESKIFEFELDAVIVWDSWAFFSGEEGWYKCRKENILNIWWLKEQTAVTISPFHQIFPVLLVTWCDYIYSLHETRSDHVSDAYWLMKWEGLTYLPFKATRKASDGCFKMDYVKTQPDQNGHKVRGRKKPIKKK